MSVHSVDINELRRLATNAHLPVEKNFLNRVIVGIIGMEKEIATLKTEILQLKKAQ